MPTELGNNRHFAANCRVVRQLRRLLVSPLGLDQGLRDLQRAHYIIQARKAIRQGRMIALKRVAPLTPDFTAPKLDPPFTPPQKKEWNDILRLKTFRIRTKIEVGSCPACPALNEPRAFRLARSSLLRSDLSGSKSTLTQTVKCVFPRQITPFSLHFPQREAGRAGVGRFQKDDGDENLAGASLRRGKVPARA